MLPTVRKAALSVSTFFSRKKAVVPEYPKNIKIQTPDSIRVRLPIGERKVSVLPNGRITVSGREGSFKLEELPLEYSNRILSSIQASGKTFSQLRTEAKEQERSQVKYQKTVEKQRQQLLAEMPKPLVGKAVWNKGEQPAIIQFISNGTVRIKEASGKETVRDWLAIPEKERNRLKLVANYLENKQQFSNQQTQLRLKEEQKKVKQEVWKQRREKVSQTFGKGTEFFKRAFSRKKEVPLITRDEVSVQLPSSGRKVVLKVPNKDNVVIRTPLAKGGKNKNRFEIVSQESLSKADVAAINEATSRRRESVTRKAPKWLQKAKSAVQSTVLTKWAPSGFRNKKTLLPRGKSIVSIAKKIILPSSGEYSTVELLNDGGVIVRSIDSKGNASAGVRKNWEDLPEVDRKRIRETSEKVSSIKTKPQRSLVIEPKASTRLAKRVRESFSNVKQRVQAKYQQYQSRRVIPDWLKNRVGKIDSRIDLSVGRNGKISFEGKIFENWSQVPARQRIRLINQLARTGKGIQAKVKVPIDGRDALRGPVLAAWEKYMEDPGYPMSVLATATIHYQIKNNQPIFSVSKVSRLEPYRGEAVGKTLTSLDLRRARIALESELENSQELGEEVVAIMAGLVGP